MRILKTLNERLPDTIERIGQRNAEILEEKFRELDDESKQGFRSLAEMTGSLLDERKEDTLNIIAKDDAIAYLISNWINERITIPVHLSTFIREMGLVYLITEYEAFLRNILEYILNTNPKILCTCKKNVTYEDIAKAQDISEVKKQIIEKEISDIINQDVEEINKYFVDKFNVDCSMLVDWLKFKERFYRRNILIHNSGIPNKLYAKKTGYLGTDRVQITQEYLAESIRIFESMAKKLIENLSMHLQKNI